MPDVDQKIPAIVGGVIVGLLSSIPSLLPSIPIVRHGTCCCCLWALLGGAVAAKMLIDRSPEPLTNRDGAWIGLLAGLIGGGIFFVILTPTVIWQMDSALLMLSNDQRIPPDIQVVYERMLHSPALKNLVSVVGVFVGSLILLGFTVLGGLLGVTLFEKRRDQSPPAQYPPNYPPQSGPYGGGPGGGQGGWPSA